MKPLHLTWPGLFLCVAILAPLCCWSADSTEQNAGHAPPSRQQIDELIEQLGSKNFMDRESAQKKLIQMDEAVPALENAAKSADQEIAQRATQILQAIAERQADEWLVKIETLAKECAVDRLVEQVVYNWHPSRKEAAWDYIGQLACTLIHREKQASHMKQLLAEGQNIMPPWFDVGGLKLGNPLEVSGPVSILRRALPNSLLVRAEKIIIQADFLPSILISTGSIMMEDAPNPGGIFFANDSLGLSARSNVIVCDGEFKGSAYNSLIIAREGVEYWHIGGSVILSGGPVRSHYKTTPGIGKSTIISTSTVEVPKGAKLVNSIIKENQPDALGRIKFFDPAQVGIEVELVNGAVQIKKVDPAKMFAKAGLQAGDVLLALDNSPVPSVESFRKQLRHRLAVARQLSFEVRRAGKTLTVTVKNAG